MKAQFESLTTQYDDNLAEMATCAARNEEGMCDVLRLFVRCAPFLSGFLPLFRICFSFHDW